jgi:hypothetical protein
MFGTQLLLLWLNLQATPGNRPCTGTFNKSPGGLNIPPPLLSGSGQCPPGHGTNDVNPSIYLCSLVMQIIRLYFKPSAHFVIAMSQIPFRKSEVDRLCANTIPLKQLLMIVPL